MDSLVHRVLKDLLLKKESQNRLDYLKISPNKHNCLRRSYKDGKQLSEKNPPKRAI